MPAEMISWGCRQQNADGAGAFFNGRVGSGSLPDPTSRSFHRAGPGLGTLASVPYPYTWAPDLVYTAATLMTGPTRCLGGAGHHRLACLLTSLVLGTSASGSDPEQVDEPPRRINRAVPSGNRFREPGCSGRRWWLVNVRTSVQKKERDANSIVRDALLFIDDQHLPFRQTLTCQLNFP